MKLVITDGGRAAAGYRGVARDCVCRSVAIAAGLPYQKVYDALADISAAQRGVRSARQGIRTSGKLFKDWMASLGFRWVPTMGFGTGCRVHLRSDELPAGWLVVSLSRHYAAVIDGVLHDTGDCSRGGTRCVYGYWILEGGKV